MTTVEQQTMLDAALEYARRGVRIFPVWGVAARSCRCGQADCSNPGKHPIGALVPRGFHDAITDEATIRKWWKAYPDGNIGTPTSWCVVLDVDPRHGGDETLAAFARQHGPLPDTPEILSGGGGRHLYFARPAVPVPNSIGKLGPGLDLRGQGGYVLLPPSRHISGGVYRDEILHPLFETSLADMPQWLLALATAQASTNGADPQEGADWAALLAGAPEGKRHAVAARIAGHFLGKGLPPAEVEQILLGYATRCAPPFPEAEVRRIVHDLAMKDTIRAASAAGPWLEPEPVPRGLPPVPAFDARRLLPDALAPWVIDIAERAQCPSDFVAVPTVVSAATVVGRKISIRPKRSDNWTVVPNLWGLVVGRPGVMKTPAILEALKPLNRLAADARLECQKKMDEHEFFLTEAQARREALKKKLREAIDKGEPTEGLRHAFEAPPYSPPTERRYVVNDSTVEKLGELLNANPNGLLLFRDELSGFLQTMDRQGHENDRAFYREAWNGAGPSYTYDRIGRGTLHIEAACVSVLGSIQPSPLHGYLREVFGGGGDDGLIQRFQLAVYPDIPRDWRNVDRWPDNEAKAHVVELFRRLDALTPEAIGAHEPTPDELPFLRFTPEAQELFDTWRAALEAKLRSDDEHPIVVSHFAKYRSLMPSLALIFHLIDCVDEGKGGPVSRDAAERAAAWCDYLEAHVRRIYESVTARGRVTTALLAAKLKAGKLPNPFRARDVYRNGWAGLTDRGDVVSALELLEDLHWLRREDVRPPESGRPTAQYQVNPRILERPR